MAYTLLKGHFVIRYSDLPRSGPEPDGDTVKFLPDNPDLVFELPRISGRPPQINARGISVRLEAIDALETHFQQTHQELEGANAARDQLLDQLGFRNVVFWEDLPNKVESADEDSVPGFVLSNGIDANGRMIGFVYKGSEAALKSEDDGATLTASTGLIDKSMNAKLLAAGQVYPAFYGTLPTRLREHLAKKSNAARKAGKGVWPRATADPNNLAEITGLESLEAAVVWPKLFRRLVSYFQAGNEGLSGFIPWLRRGSDDKIFRLDTKTNATLSDVITVDGNGIMMDVWPEDIIVEPAPAAERSRL